MNSRTVNIYPPPTPKMIFIGLVSAIDADDLCSALRSRFPRASRVEARMSPEFPHSREIFMDVSEFSRAHACGFAHGFCAARFKDRLTAAMQRDEARKAGSAGVPPASANPAQKSEAPS